MLRWTEVPVSTKRSNPPEAADVLRRHAEGLQGEIDRCVEVEEGLADRLATQPRKDDVRDELFRLLVHSVGDYAIFMLDPRGIVVTWNAGAERIKGYRAEEIIGRHFSTFYPEQDVRAGKCEHEIEVVVAEGRFEDEGWRIRKDGSRFWANVVLTAVRDRAGRLTGLARVTRDLSDRKQAEDQRAAVEDRFRLLVESVQDYALFALDPSGKVSTWNRGAERIKGYTATEIIGSHFSRFYPAEDVQAGKCEHELEVAAREGRFEDEGWRIRKDGSAFWANVVISAVRDGTGVLVGFAKVTRDLTERKRTEEERAARLAAERANRTKDEFLAMLGHELRNPLSPIVTALQLIKLRGETTWTQEHQIIERQVNHMMHLVDDLLDVSRIARGKVDLKKRQIDLRDAIAKAIEIASPLFEQRQHHLAVDALRRPLIVDGDEARLTQVFANLLTNAAKYTDPGGHVFVAVRHSGSEAVVEVRDDGSGIHPELLPRIFDLFVQGSQSAERAGGGLGLGLTLVRSLVSLHGGQVDARSEGPGLGSQFTVRLPAIDGAVPADQAAQAAPAFPATEHQQRILLVDDNEDARFLLCEILMAVGHDVKTAGDPLDALALIERFKPEVAILDIGLPVMDGYELAIRLREALPDSPPRLIALSGYGLPADQLRSQQAGFDLHLVKPVDVRRLLDAIR
jgi:hypothetical protein